MEGRISALAVLCLVLSSVGALKVTIPEPQYEFARGDNITLPCSFKSTLAAPRLVIISWSAEAPTANAKETLILTYYFPSKLTDIKSMYEGRVSLDVSIPTGKANLKLSSITLADNKVFECRVQIPTDDEGTPAATVRLVVLVAPSTPICKTQGKAEYGQNINLTCVSAEGSPTPTYKWDSRDVRNMPRAAPHPRTTDKGGILSLYNITKDTSGIYTCTSRNKIRSATCNISLAVMPPSLTFGSTAIIAVAVSAVVLIALIVIIFCCCRHRKKKREEEEYAMGVPGEEFHDKEPARNGERRQADRDEDTRVDRDPNEERSQRGYDSRKDNDEPHSDYDDRRSEYDDRRSDYDDRRSDYNDRRSDYSDRRDRNSDRNERHDDERSYNERRDRRNDDDDRYDEPHDDRPPVPNNKPLRRDYDD
ncbi:cell surface A33 antigen [Hippoglossus stenolepis]|uniref:cell surface A33 antigen n=1 Tax=Hippoglossus stenolepis TaxID=195615 RepID=UPI00159C0075|nr:cell surface A33 antigen [Hippoglossus stenolepis]